MNAYKIGLSLFLLLISSFSYSADKRIERARNEFERFAANEVNLKEGEYFLISLKVPIRPASLEELVGQYEMHLENIHYCTARGVLIVPFKKDETILASLAAIDLQQKIGGARHYVTPTEIGDDLSPGDPKLCGFVSTMSNVMATRFYAYHKENVLAIEIGNQKRKYFAINHNLIRED